MAAVALIAGVAWSLEAPAAKGRKKKLWSFDVVEDGKVTAEMEFGVVRREGTVFGVAAMYPPARHEKKKKKKRRPLRRAYTELREPGYLGKYKRWDRRGRAERYWILFEYKGTVKVRYEKGPGAKGKVTELGKADQDVVPLDQHQPLLAYLLAASFPDGTEVQCAGAGTRSWGKARVEHVGTRALTTAGGWSGEAKEVRISGDCGGYTVYLLEGAGPVVVVDGDVRYERVSMELPQPDPKDVDAKGEERIE